MTVNNTTILQDKKTGLYYREEAKTDLIVIREQEQKAYKHFWPLCKDQIVLDIGGYIGESSYFALQAGAKKVYSLEPSPPNLSVYYLQNHLKDPRLQLIEAAIAPDNGTAKFYITPNEKATGSNSLKKVRGREEVEVTTISWKEILDIHKPTAIKMDCEGGEGDLDFTLIPDNVVAISMELHPRYTKGGMPRIQEIITYLNSRFTQIFYRDSLLFGKPDNIEITWKK